MVERPDGFHWIDETGHQEFGPFPTAASALEDMAGDSARGDEEVDALRIAESGIDVGAEQREAPGDDPPEEAA